MVTPTTAPLVGASSLVDARAKIDAVLTAHLRAGEPVALLGAPDYANVGDSLLWLAQRTWLRDHGVRVRAVAPYGRTDHVAVGRALGRDGTVLLSAGGHLTDRWPTMLEGIRSTIAAHPGHRVLVLPQSVHFDDPAAGTELAATVAVHGAVTVLVRDRASVGRAADVGLGVVEWCPDLALLDLGLERRAAPVRAEAPPVVVRRADAESASPGARTEPATASKRGSDRAWISPWPGSWSEWRSGWPCGRWLGARASWRALARVSPRVAADPTTGGRLVDAQARLAVERGVGIIGSADLVVTDRLHAALLAVVLGRSVVAVDSATGKVHNVLRGCFPDDEQIRFVRSWPEAEAWLATRGAARAG